MYRRLADTLLVGICVTQDGKICYANQGFAQLVGYDVESLSGYAVTDLLASPSDSLPPLPQAEEDTEQPQRFAYQTTLQTRHGEALDVGVSGTQACIKGKCLRFIVVQRAGVCGQQDSSVQLARLVYEHSAQAIVVTDKQGIVVDANPAFGDITGYSLEEMKGRNMSALSSSRQSPDFYKQMWQALSQTGQWEGDIWNRRKNGEEYAERLHISTIWNADGTVYRRIGLFSDITQHKKTRSLDFASG
ncbi:MAG TPA: PAS domain S-box protein [Paenalcaligenes sp.]|nr:PAS domain S-box protein [Paenalcaligenes sp.]